MPKAAVNHSVRALPDAAAALGPSIEALLAIRSGLARVLEALPDIRRAADVEKALGLDRPLAWRIFRTATASDAAGALQNLPSVVQLKKAMGAARKHGVSAKIANEVEEAQGAFEREIAQVAGDRTAFGALLSGHLSRGLSPIEQRVRKQAFKANAHLWGEQVRTTAFFLAIQPNEDGRTYDAIVARGWVDLHASRPKPTTLLYSVLSVADADRAAPSESSPHASLAPRMGQMEVVRAFSAERSPEVVTQDVGEGKQEAHLRLTGIGRESRVTLFVRVHIWQAAPLNEVIRLTNLACRPAEALHMDLLLPRGWSDQQRTKALAFARPYDVNRSHEFRAVDQIPAYDHPEFIPDVENVPPTPDVPRWPDLVRHVLDERGWWGRRFEMYRLQVAYPMIHACLGMEAWPLQGD